MRGAGANLGVVTSFTFRLHEVGPTVYGGLIAWPFERADEILRAYRTITTEAPRELAVWLLLLHAPPAPFVPPEWHGKKICAMAVCYSGDLDGVDEAIAPLRALGDPVVDLLREQPYVEVQSYLDETEPKGIAHYWKTEYLAELSDDLLSTMRDVAAENHHPEGEIGVLHVGGALNDHHEDNGAVGDRDARYALGVKAMWDPHQPDGHRFPNGSATVGSGCDRSRPAAPTSTSRPPTRKTTASGRPTAPTSTASSRSSRPTTPRTCSAPTETSALGPMEEHDEDATARRRRGRPDVR